MTYAEILLVAFSGVWLANAFMDYSDPDERMIFSCWGRFVKDKFWLKPLGGCQTCTQVWAYFIMYILHIFTPSIWLFLTGLVFAHWLLILGLKYDLL